MSDTACATDYALEFLNISCVFKTRDAVESRYTAVANTTLRIPTGQFLSVFGPTGCGKSTMPNIGAGYRFQSGALMP